MEFDNGKVLAQSKAVLRFVARRFGRCSVIIIIIIIIVVVIVIIVIIIIIIIITDILTGPGSTSVTKLLSRWALYINDV